MPGKLRQASAIPELHTECQQSRSCIQTHTYRSSTLWVSHHLHFPAKDMRLLQHVLVTSLQVVLSNELEERSGASPPETRQLSLYSVGLLSARLTTQQGLWPAILPPYPATDHPWQPANKHNSNVVGFANKCLRLSLMKLRQNCFTFFFSSLLAIMKWILQVLEKRPPNERTNPITRKRVRH